MRRRAACDSSVRLARVPESQIIESRQCIDNQRIAYLQEQNNSRAQSFAVFEHVLLRRADRTAIYGAHCDLVMSRPQLFWWVSIGCITAVHHTALDVVMRFEETDAGLALLRLTPWCVADDVNADRNMTVDAAMDERIRARIQLDGTRYYRACIYGKRVRQLQTEDGYRALYRDMQQYLAAEYY